MYGCLPESLISMPSQSDLCDRFPDRSRFLDQAFDAHRRGDYALAIPVFLIQADGICKETVGEQLYARANGVPRLAEILGAENEAPLRASLLSPLTDPHPISASPHERSGGPEQLFRHAILHGESLDYDTRANACRSISLLVYVAWVLRVLWKEAG